MMVSHCLQRQGFDLQYRFRRNRLANTPALILGVILLPILSHASVNTVQFTNSPALYPAFDPAVRDYVILLSSTSQVVQVSVTNSGASDSTTTVSVDGQSPTAGAFTTSLTLLPSGKIRVDRTCLKPASLADSLANSPLAG